MPMPLLSAPAALACTPSAAASEPLSDKY